MYTPLHDNVLIRKTDADPEMTKRGSLYLPGGDSSQFVSGRVVSRGPGILLQNGTYLNMECGVDDIVHFHPSQSYECVVNGEKLLLVKYENIVAFEGP